MAGTPATAPQSGEPPVSLGGYSQFRAPPFSARHAWASGKAGSVQRVSCFGLWRTAAMDGCDGLSPRFRKGQSGIPAPPVVDQPHGAGGEPTTRQITGAVPAPAPLMLLRIWGLTPSLCPRPWLLLPQEWPFAADFRHHPQGEPPRQGKNQPYQRYPAKSVEVTTEFRIMGVIFGAARPMVDLQIRKSDTWILHT